MGASRGLVGAVAVPGCYRRDAMQVFRPADVDLEDPAAPDDGFAQAAGPGAPVTRSGVRIESVERGLRSGVWESGPGTAEYVFSIDEWAYILDGEASVTAAGTTHQLSAGDVFYTPAGERMSWVVPTHVRKVWVHRRPPLPGRIRRKLAKVLGRTRSAAHPSGILGRPPSRRSGTDPRQSCAPPPSSGKEPWTTSPSSSRPSPSA